jgi:ACS family hexuronate transporter-like MFS transporter
MASIGRCAWIPFFVAGLDNLGGGLIVKMFLYCKLRTTTARKASVTVAAELMTAAIPVSGLGGMVFVLVTGWLVERYSYVPVFLFFGLIPLICVTVLWLLMGSLESESKFRDEVIMG